jgi:HlyD family secretion protein
MSSKQRIPALAIVVLLAGLAAGCGAGPTAAAGPVSVQVARAAKGQITAKLNLNGTVQSQAQVAVLPEVAGRIVRLNVRMGGEVKAGDVIAELDSAVYKAQQKQAEAALAAAQAKLSTLAAGARPEQVALAGANLKAAQEKLAAMREGGRPETIAQAEANLTAAQARLEQVKKGPTPEQLAVAQQQLKIARDQEYLTQQNVEEMTVRTDDGQSHSPLTPMFSKGIGGAQSGIAFENTKLVEAQIAQLTAPPTAEQLAQLQAAVDVASQQLALAKTPYSAHDIAQAESAVAVAEQQLALAQQPYTTGDLNAAKAAVEQAQAALDLAKIQVQKATIVAPLDARVSQKLLSEGAMAGPTTPIVTLVAKEAEVVVNVEEARLGSLRLGQAATITAAALPGEKLGGQVVAIAPAVDQKTHSVAVRLKTDVAGKLLEGMSVQVNLLAGEQVQALLVPTSAILERDGRKVAFVVNNGVVSQRVVTTGLADGSMVEVVDGVSDGEAVVVGGLGGLADGQQVSLLR